MKIVTIIGARPQFIKASIISRQLSQYENIEEILVHTGQHYDFNMSDIFFDEISIPIPKYNLGIGGKSHGEMTGDMVKKIEEILFFESPDYVLLYGDTNSTLSGAIAASKLHMRIIHVEAGLRSFNMKMPEEINRILTDRVSSLLFCPTKAALNNLSSEGLEFWSAEAFLSGDIMQDGAFFYSEKAKKIDLELKKGNFVLCTIHRPENTDNNFKLKEIFKAISLLSKEINIILPLHPRTKLKIEEAAIKISDNIQVINPIGYLNMIWLIKNCNLVITDSGGLQKEAFFFSKYCITLRDETEWVELIEEGVNILAGASTNKILSAFKKFNTKYPVNFDQSIYGDGLASKNIVKEIIKDFSSI